MICPICGNDAGSNPTCAACGNPVAPTDEAMSAVTAWLKSTNEFFAPGYHYDMMHDIPRNDAYESAIKEVTYSPTDGPITE